MAGWVWTGCGCRCDRRRALPLRLSGSISCFEPLRSCQSELLDVSNVSVKVYKARRSPRFFGRGGKAAVSAGSCFLFCLFILLYLGSDRLAHVGSGALASLCVIWLYLSFLVYYTTRISSPSPAAFPGPDPRLVVFVHVGWQGHVPERCSVSPAAHVLRPGRATSVCSAQLL